jgi:phosphoribosylaminoimidazolecarboxamide formyltransferase/IMP cyclohydrolase
MVNIVDKVDNWVEIQRVLISVSDKAGLDLLVPGLVEINPRIQLFSTGGTYRAIAAILGDDLATEHLTPVSAYTGQPETQGGLVKTLDFKIYLGLLTETHNPAHQADLARTEAVPIDMVVVNLYPFEATVAQEGATVEAARANIDIGGPSMLRAAAKNYLRVAPVVDPADYGRLLNTLTAGKGALDLKTRFEYARKAFGHTASYDAAIVAFMRDQDPDRVPATYADLRSGRS